MLEQNVVLVVDNDQDNHFFLCKAWKKLGVLSYKFVFFNDGQELMDYLNARAPCAQQGENLNHCLILLNLDMPQESGFEVLKTLKKDTLLCQIPVVALTTYGDAEDRQRSYDMGAELFLSNPHHLEGYIMLIEILQFYYRLRSKF